jgi:hypothetical protein
MIYLDLVRTELQAMTAFESKIHLQSRAKCCNDARAIAKFAWICYDKVCSFRLVAGRATTKVRYRFHDRVKRAKELGEGEVPGRQRHAGKAIMAKGPAKGRYDILRGEVKKTVTR